MNETVPLDDDELLEHLRQLARRHDPVPASVVNAAKGAFALRTLDDELADLLFDSLLDESLVGVRGTASRQLTFGVRDLTIDLDIDADGLVGQIVPSGPTAVELEMLDGNSAADVDDLGRFFLARPSGPFRLRVGVAGHQVTTEWVNL